MKIPQVCSFQCFDAVVLITWLFFSLKASDRVVAGPLHTLADTQFKVLLSSLLSDEAVKGTKLSSDGIESWKTRDQGICSDSV